MAGGGPWPRLHPRGALIRLAASLFACSANHLAGVAKVDRARARGDGGARRRLTRCRASFEAASCSDDSARVTGASEGRGLSGIGLPRLTHRRQRLAALGARAESLVRLFLRATGQPPCGKDSQAVANRPSRHRAERKAPRNLRGESLVRLCREALWPGNAPAGPRRPSSTVQNICPKFFGLTRLAYRNTVSAGR